MRDNRLSVDPGVFIDNDRVGHAVELAKRNRMPPPPLHYYS